MYPRKFDSQEFTESWIWNHNLMKSLVFLSINTWGSLRQQKVFDSLGLKNPCSSIKSSISSNLDAGRRKGLYRKEGKGKEAKFSLTYNFLESSQVKQISFIPSENAIKIAKQRAKSFSSRRSS